jgi:hypothetical protein
MAIGVGVLIADLGVGNVNLVAGGASGAAVWHAIVSDVVHTVINAEIYECPMISPSTKVGSRGACYQRNDVPIK